MANDYADPKPIPVYARARLADMLAEAAELEHSLCCQYLYAAVSMKRTVAEGLSPKETDMVRGWERIIMEVAREEMEHLGLVINIQTAIGEAPHLDRPNFPLDPQYYETGVESKLEKFGIETMQRFVMFELPAPDSPLVTKTARELRRLVGSELASKHMTIGQLYNGIKELMKEIDAQGNLFIGPPGAQFKMTDNAMPGQVFRSSETGVGSAYGVDLNGVVDLESALKAVDQIVEEGEGSTGEREDCHFGKFLNILEELTDYTLKNPCFEPARDVVDNPRSMVVGRGNAQKEGTLITNVEANKISRAFDQAYTSLMLLLARFFGATDQGPDDSMALEMAAFFPMMTMVIRPLSEVLTALPAFDPLEVEMMDISAEEKEKLLAKRAGPTFRFERRTALLPHRDSAFDNIATNLNMLEQALRECSEINFAKVFDLTEEQAAWLTERVSFMVENVWRINDNFKNATGAESVLDSKKDDKGKGAAS